MLEEKLLLKNKLIVLDKQQAGVAARRNFMDMCAFNGTRPMPPKKIERALGCLDLILGQLKLRAVISEYPGSCASEMGLNLDKAFFNWPLLSRLDGDVRRIYVYLLTAGRPAYQANSALDEVYADLWLNAYMDAGLDMLRQYVQRLEANGSRYVSRSVGPGLYGMDTSAVRQIFTVLDSGKIQVELLDGGLMAPIKSFVGLFIVTDRPWDIGEDCQNCPGGAPSCRYCKLGYRTGRLGDV